MNGLQHNKEAVTISILATTVASKTRLLGEGFVGYVDV